MPNLSPRSSERRTSIEQRAYPRFEVNARCHLVGFPSGAGEGVTENLSRGGVLLRLKPRNSMAVLPAIGEVLTVDIELPANLRFGQKYLRCRGSVVRVFNSRQSPPPCGSEHFADGIQRQARRQRGQEPQRQSAGAVFRGGMRMVDPRDRNRKRKGQAVIEIALMTPWIFLLFIAIFDFGFYAYTFISVENATRVAALYTSSSPIAANDQAGACFHVLQELQMMANVAPILTSSTCTAAPVQVAAAALDSTTTPPSADGQPATQVTVTYDTVQLIPLPWISGKMSITRVVQARVKPE